MKGNIDILIIGGGAIGLCSAYYLAEQGLSVSVVEQEDIVSGCSGANAGLIVPGYKNLIVATGHCMLGITLAPITGKLISQLACEIAPDVDLTPLSVARFK